MKALFENIDLFAHKINFNYEKKNLYHSFFGIGLTFAVYGVMVYFVYYFSKDFVNYTNPKIIYKETEFDDNATIKLQDLIGSQLSFNITIVVDASRQNKSKIDEFDKYLNETYVSPRSIGKFFIYHKAEDGSIKQAAFLNFSINIQSLYLDEWNQYGYLLKGNLNENSTIFSENFEGEEHLEENKLELYNACPSKRVKFKDFNFTVENEDEIIFGFIPRNFKLISGGWIQFSFKYHIRNIIINANSPEFFKQYSSPKTSRDSYCRVLNETYYYCFSLVEESYHGMNGLNNDRGFIFSEIDKKFSLKQNYYLNVFKETEDKILMYSIKIDRLMKMYDRIYKKLQNVFADLGGILSSFILIGNILIVQFNKKKFDYDLINKVFKFEKEVPSEQMEMRSGLKNLKINSNDISENVAILDAKSSRNFMKNSQKIQILNKNNAYHQNKSVCDPKSDEKNMNLYDVSSVKNEQRRKPKNSDYQDKDDINISSVSSVNPDKKEPAQENDLEINAIDLFAKNFENENMFKKPLKYSKKDFFKSFLCCEELKGTPLLMKEKVFNFAQKQIYEYMDVVNFVQLFEKIESLISIIFNEHQVLSFNFIKGRHIDEIQSKKIDKESIKKVVEYYRQNKKESNMNIIDERLLKTFYPSFSKLI